MKKSFIFIIVLAALTVFCSAAIAQYGYAVPTLETVREDGRTVNVYTYRDGNGYPFRTIEYYVNDDGSYGNRDVYYGNNGLESFRVQTDYKNGVCTTTAQSISYSENDLATVNTRETTFNPDGKVDVLTYTTRELGEDTSEVTGMETDGQGRKICDFKEEYYKDAENNQASRRTVYKPDKMVEVIHRTEKQDGSEIRREWIFDENDKELYSLYVSEDANGNEVYNEAVKYTYGENGQITAEFLISDGETNTRLSYIEKWQEDDTSSTAEGELQDKNGNKLADYSFEKTWGKDESEVTVATFIYPNGRVDIISKTVDADGNLSIQKQLDFKASGEKTEETPDDDFDYENFFKWSENEMPEDIDEDDEELIRYFEEINDVWGETYDGDSDVRSEDSDDWFEDSSTDTYAWDNSGTEFDETDEYWDEDNSDDSEFSGYEQDSYADTGYDNRVENNSGGYELNNSYDSGSGDWGGNDGGSDDGDDGGSDDWGGDDSGYDDWD